MNCVDVVATEVCKYTRTAAISLAILTFHRRRKVEFSHGSVTMPTLTSPTRNGTVLSAVMLLE